LGKRLGISLRTLPAIPKRPGAFNNAGSTDIGPENAFAAGDDAV
jgi:hypothetical protein